MGIDYSSALAYGFVVDEVKLRALNPEVFDDGGGWDAMEAFLKDYKTLAFDNGGAYDTEGAFAVVANSTNQNHGYRDRAFGVFSFSEIPKPTDEEWAEIKQAYDQIGFGQIGPLAIFSCS